MAPELCIRLNSVCMYGYLSTQEVSEGYCHLNSVRSIGADQALTALANRCVRREGCQIIKGLQLQEVS